MAPVDTSAELAGCAARIFYFGPIGVFFRLFSQFPLICCIVHKSLDVSMSRCLDVIPRTTPHAPHATVSVIPGPIMMTRRLNIKLGAARTWPNYGWFEILGKCSCLMFRDSRQMSRHDMTLTVPDPWQMSRRDMTFAIWSHG